MIAKGFLRCTILKHIITEGFAPDLETLSEILKKDTSEVEKALYELQEYDAIEYVSVSTCSSSTTLRTLLNHRKYIYI